MSKWISAGIQTAAPVNTILADTAVDAQSHDGSALVTPTGGSLQIVICSQTAVIVFMELLDSNLAVRKSQAYTIGANIPFITYFVFPINMNAGDRYRLRLGTALGAGVSAQASIYIGD